VIGIPASKRKIEDKHAVHAIIDMANAEPGTLSIVAVGPLTNIAVATMLDPSLPSKIKELTIMGGAVTGKGNDNVTAEFNIAFDPEAARIVFDKWPMVRAVDWEITVANGLGKEEIAQMHAIQSPRAEFYRNISAKTIKVIKEYFHMDMIFTADGLAMAAALEPSVIKSKEIKHLTVELRGESTRGMTVVDWVGMGGQKPNAEIITAFDKPRYMEMIKEGLN